MRGAVLALLLFGCGTAAAPIADPPESQSWPRSELVDFASRVVWNHVFEQRTPLPQVRIVTGTRLNCHAGRGFLALTMTRSWDCVGGIFYPGPRTAYVAVPPGVPIHETSLAHELTHALLHDQGNPDPGHVSDAWRIGGHVMLANAVLASLFKPEPQQ